MCISKKRKRVLIESCSAFFLSFSRGRVCGCWDVSGFVLVYLVLGWWYRLYAPGSMQDWLTWPGYFSRRAYLSPHFLHFLLSRRNICQGLLFQLLSSIVLPSHQQQRKMRMDFTSSFFCTGSGECRLSAPRRPHSW